MAETDLTPEEAASDERLSLYNDGAVSVSNPYGFADGGYLANQMRQGRDTGMMGRLARRLALFTHGLANTVAANVLLTAEDASNTALDRIATAQNVGLAADEVVKAAEQAQKLVGTSTTAVTPAVASRTFTTQPGKYFAVGTFLTIVSTAAPTTRWMAGQVTAYNATTGALTVNVEAIGATTSAAASWNIYLGGPRGAQGVQGAPGVAAMTYLARSANTQLVQSDSAALIDATGTFTQTFAAPATLGANWYCFYKNAGTGNITIPASDGRTNWIMYPGEMRLLQCDGTTLRSEVLNPFSATFIASGNFIKPPGYLRFSGLLWAGGGGGGTTSGGGGGACIPIGIEAALLSDTTAVTIGAGGAGNGAAGSNSSFGAITAFGGAGGNGSSGGGGGGTASAASGASGGNPPSPGFGGGNGGQAPGQSSGYGGGGGSGTTAPGGSSLYGGGGGAGGNSPGMLGGVSIFGGNGGGRGLSGQAPGGGAGDLGSAGARGELRLWGVL